METNSSFPPPDADRLTFYVMNKRIHPLVLITSNYCNNVSKEKVKRLKYEKVPAVGCKAKNETEQVKLLGVTEPVII